MIEETAHEEGWQEKLYELVAGQPSIVEHNIRKLLQHYGLVRARRRRSLGRCREDLLKGWKFWTQVKDQRITDFDLGRAVLAAMNYGSMAYQMSMGLVREIGRQYRSWILHLGPDESETDDVGMEVQEDPEWLDRMSELARRLSFKF